MLLQERQRRADSRLRLRNDFESLYPWQYRFVMETASHTACMLMAANRVGKTRTGLVIDASHLTGDYHEDWPGHRFTQAPMCWLLGYSMEKTRDLLQKVLFGTLEGGKWTGGLVTPDRILGHISSNGTSGAMREVRVRHASGGVAICQFWSYSQGQHALMGDSVDWVHVDEEPEDKEIFPQVLTRLATGDQGQGGKMILTFTPENGRTDLVRQFMDDPNEGMYLQRATWNDAPHLTEKTKELLLGMYPEWQRDMRTKGEPLMGAGLIFDIGNDAIKCDPFVIPDHWWLINGMDFGWDHPQAHVQLAWDKDEDIIYVTHAWKKSKTLPEVAWATIKPWAKGVPAAWPHDGHQHGKGDGKELSEAYKDSGWSTLPEHATWQTGGYGLEIGVVELYSRMSKGTLKVFSNLSDWFDEKLNYHRDEDGKIVKVRDDLLSATRYAYMMRRYAKQKGQVGVVRPVMKPRIRPTVGQSQNWMGN